MNNIKLYINTDRMHAQSLGRGIGMYARSLEAELAKKRDIELVMSEAEADIVHYPFFDLFYPTLPLMSKKTRVVTVHDVIPLLYPDQYPAGKKGNLAFVKQKLALGRVSAVITDSETSKHDIANKLKYPEKQIKVVPLASNPDLIAAKPAQIDEINNKYQIKRPYVLYVGDINYNKNIPQMIKMMKFLPEEINLVCLGANFKKQNIPEWQVIETQLALSNVENQVQFLTQVSDSTELAAIYSGAVCYVQPSFYEGFGLPLLEAMTCKTPVVSSNTPALLELGKDKALFADPEAEALADQVKEVLGWSQAKRKEWIRAGLKHAEKFTWAKVAKETLEVYRSVI